MNYKTALIFIFIFSPAVYFAQNSDTIVVKTEKIKGFGPFGKAMLFAGEMQPENPWRKAEPEIKGVPENLENTVCLIEYTDFLQHAYYSYKHALIPKDLYEGCKESWGWNPDPEEYTGEVVKTGVVIAAGYDNTGKLKIKVDRNNNYDLSDDEFFTLPEKKEGENLFTRYNEDRLFETEYEYYEKGEIKKAKVWLYLDYGLSPAGANFGVPEFSYAFAEHHIGEFYLNGLKYFAAVYHQRPVLREQYKVKVWPEDDPDKADEQEIKRNGFVKIGEDFYRPAEVSLTGSEITFVKDNSVLETGGNIPGLKAVNFKAESISGKKIELNDYRGKVVLLDFWGTWCAPCRREIPELKKIYNEFASEDFVMIGIANDKKDKLRKFVAEERIKWDQILQEEDHSILEAYDVTGYPTAYLINKEGVIIGKGLSAALVKEKLKEIFEADD